MADASLAQVAPEVVELARLSAVATIVEPALLRRLRLVLLPALDAGVESDLWFSPLVATASSTGLTLRPSVADALRAELGHHRLAPAARRIVDDLHRGYSELLRLEEDVIWAAIINTPDAVEAAMHRVLTSVQADQAAAPDLFRWLRQAFRRMPAVAAEVPSGQELLTLSALFLDRQVPAGLIGSNGFGSGVTRAAPGVRQLTLKVSMDGEGLRFEPESPFDSLTETINVPDTDPPVLEVRWGDHSRVIDASPGAHTELPGLGSEATLRTLLGRRYHLTALPAGPARVRPRHLISVVSASDDGEPQAEADVQSIRDWLGDLALLGSRAFRPWIREDLGEPRAALEGVERVSQLWTADEAAVVHVVGHGKVVNGQLHLDSSFGASALRLADLLEVLRSSWIRNLLILIDTCQAGQAFAEVDVREVPSNWLLIASAPGTQLARSGAFTHAVRRAIAGYDSEKPYLTVSDFVEALRMDLVDQDLVAYFSGDWNAPHVCLPNPNHAPLRATSRILDSWSPGDRTADEPWRIIARAGAIHELLREPPADDVLVLTGAPGSGKSVILDYLIAFGDPAFAQEHREALEEVPAELRPPAGWADMAVYASGLDTAELLQRIGAGLGLDLSSSDDTASAAALELGLGQRNQRGLRTRIVIDALDEMQIPTTDNRPTTILARLARVPGTRIVVGSRAISLDGDVDELTPIGGHRIDLDVPDALSNDAVRDYLTKLLMSRPDSPYRSRPEESRALAESVVRTFDRDFGRARASIQRLAEQARVMGPADAMAFLQASAGVTRSDAVGAVSSQVVCAIDVQGYSRMGAGAKAELQSLLHAIRARAVELSGIDDTSQQVEPRGDGEVVVWASAPENSVFVEDFARNFAAELSRVNALRSPGRQIRVRLALSLGIGEPSKHGLTGQSVVRAARLVDSDEARRALKAAGSSPLALLVDDALYQETRERFAGPGKRELVRVVVRTKEGQVPAWVAVPGGGPGIIRNLQAEFAQAVGLPGLGHREKDAESLLLDWQVALADGLLRAGYQLPQPGIRLVAYSHLFRGDTISGQPGLSDIAAPVEDLPEDEKQTIVDATREVIVQGSTGTSGTANRLIRALDSMFGSFASFAFIGALREAHWYLTDRRARRTIDAVVAEAVTSQTEILIGHSLGSVVAFEYIRQHPGRQIGLLLTTGSMLGLKTVRSRLSNAEYGVAEGIPPNVGRWVNIRDPRDPMAAAGDLRAFWPGVEDVTVDNGNVPHAANRYLSSAAAGTALRGVLSPGGTDGLDEQQLRGIRAEGD